MEKDGKRWEKMKISFRKNGGRIDSVHAVISQKNMWLGGVKWLKHHQVRVDFRARSFHPPEFIMGVDQTSSKISNIDSIS
jgi:hypothetical protein